MTARITALVIGASGFLGRHVAKALAEEGRSVVGLGHGSWSQTEWSSYGIGEWHTCDVNLKNLIVYGGEPDEIYHCAGSGSVALSIKNPREDFERNTVTTIDVLEFARRLPPGRPVVFPSTAAVYGKVVTTPISVATPPNPVSPYGVHKLIGETLCKSYAEHFGVHTAIVRYFSIYGAGLRKQLLWDACNKLSVGDTTFFGTGQETRDWIHISDAAQLMIRAGTSASTTPPIYNGGSGEKVTIRAIVERLAQILSIREDIRFSSEARPGDPQHYLADIAETQTLGWRPEKSLDQGLLDYASWFMSEETVLKGRPRAGAKSDVRI
jgi:UDP-glucose 4-epimerase